MNRTSIYLVVLYVGFVATESFTVNYIIKHVNREVFLFGCFLIYCSNVFNEDCHIKGINISFSLSMTFVSYMSTTTSPAAISTPSPKQNKTKKNKRNLFTWNMGLSSYLQLFSVIIPRYI